MEGEVGMNEIYADTETTGLRNASVVEIALVGAAGNTLLHTYVNPGIPIPAEAAAIHHITDAMVAGATTMAELMPAIIALCRGKRVIIYNRAYDLPLLPGVEKVAESVECAMLRAQDAMGVSRWPKLIAAAEWAGYVWVGDAHSALADTLTARHVWLHCNGALA